MARKIARSFSTRRPRLKDFAGGWLRDYIEALDAWLDKLQAFQAEPGSRRDRYIAKTSGSVSANVGASGPMGSGNVIRLQIQDDDTLLDVGDGELIPVRSLVTTLIGTDRLVIVELIDGKDVITAIVCP